MMKKYGTLILLIFLVLSLGGNIVLFTSRQQNASKTAQAPANVPPQESNITTNIPKEEGVLPGNPIDVYFNNEATQNYSGTTAQESSLAAAHTFAWKNEMNAAYQKLEALAHSDLVDNIKKSQRLFESFVENEFYLGMALFSDAYGDELGNYGEHILYGTGAPASGTMTEANLYKARTYDLFRYLECAGQEVSFVFDGDTFVPDEV